MVNRVVKSLMFVCVTNCLFITGLFAGGTWAVGGCFEPNESDRTVVEVPPHVPGEVIVKFVEQPGPKTMVSVETVIGIRVQWRTLRHAPHAKGMPNTPHPLSYYRIATVDPQADVVALSKQVAALPGIVFASINTIPEPTLIPNDPLFGSQWAHQKINTEGAWDISTGSTDIIIGIIDTGCLINHEDLADHIWVNDDPVNGIDDDNNGFIDDTNGWDFVRNNNNISDVYGHGTQVSGITSAGIDNGVGVAGIGNTTIMTSKWWHTSGSDSSIAESCYYATDNGAHVLNLSLSCQCQLPLTEDAVNYAYDAGVVVVAASGNAGSSSPGYPAGYPNVMAVGAININDQRAGFSNYGPHLDVGAPSPGILTTSHQGTTSYDSNFGGTSAASPHVAGLAALVLSVDPSLTPDEVRQVINDNADDLGAAGFDNFFGHGRINCAATIAALTPPSVVPDAVSIVLGTGNSGGIAELTESDNQYLVLDPEFLNFRYQLEFTVDATSPSETPGALEFSYESRTFSFVGAVVQNLELYNYDTAQFETVDSGLSAATDTVVSVTPSGDPTRFVEAGTAAMQARIRYENAFPFWVFSTQNLYLPYRVRADHVFWTISP